MAHDQVQEPVVDVEEWTKEEEAALLSFESQARPQSLETNAVLETTAAKPAAPASAPHSSGDPASNSAELGSDGQQLSCPDDRAPSGAKTPIISEGEAMAEPSPEVLMAEEGQSLTSERIKVDIPFVGPGWYGVWEGYVNELGMSGVRELHQYLVRCWNHEKGVVPLSGNCGSPLCCYAEYMFTAAEYDRNAQMQNTIRWSHKRTRLEAIRKGLPGFAEVECAVEKAIAVHFAERICHGLTLHNGHILRQSLAADGGSSFCYHIDEADDADATYLYLSVAVKLTDDPVASDGSWMQVDGFQPVQYGSGAGSLVMFISRKRHRSLRTSANMRNVYKLVLFYKFTDPHLRDEFRELAPSPPPWAAMLESKSISPLPPQVCTELNLCPYKVCPAPVNE